MYLLEQITARLEIETLSYSMVEQLFRLQASPAPSPSLSWVEFVEEDASQEFVRSPEPALASVEAHEPIPVLSPPPAEAGLVFTDDVTLTDPVCVLAVFSLLLLGFACMSRRIPSPVVVHPKPQHVVVDVKPLKDPEPHPKAPPPP